MADDNPGATGAATALPRVAVVTCSYFPEDMRVRREAEALVAAGFSVDLLCLRRRTEPAREFLLGINVHRLPLERRRGGKLRYLYQYAFCFLLVFFRLAWLRLKNRYDLVHVHNMPDAMIFAAIVPKLTGAKLVLDISDPMPEVFMTKFGLPRDHLFIRLVTLQERWSTSFAHWVVTPNISFRDILVERSCPGEKVGIVMNMPPEGIFAGSKNKDSRTTGDPDSFTVMYHGTIVKRHGLHIALEALAMVREKIGGLKLQVYGEGEFVDPFLEAARALNLQDMVVYNGFVPIEKIVGEIGRCDVGIVPNMPGPFTEINLPTRIFEFLVLGKPVISPRTMGILDYFDDETMFFFEPGDARSLADCLLKVHGDPEDVAGKIEKGIAVCREYSWEKEERKFVARINDLLNRRSCATDRA